MTSHLGTISITGWWPEPLDRVADVIDKALHEAGLCACDKRSGYSIACREEELSNTTGPSRQHSEGGKE